MPAPVVRLAALPAALLIALPAAFPAPPLAALPPAPAARAQSGIEAYSRAHSAPRTAPADAGSAAAVDVNRASLAELESVAGITPVWAARIVRYRPYASRYQLRTRGILPPSLYVRVRPYLVAHHDMPAAKPLPGEAGPAGGDATGAPPEH
jgi:DNA uptake protein ComE-like DNA-binding protein